MLTGSLPQAASDQPEASERRRTHARPGPRRAWGAGAGGIAAKSDVDDRAGQGAGDAVEVLHLRDHQLAELVDVAGLGAHDHVVRTGDVLGEGHALDLGDRAWPPRRPCRRRSGSGCTPGRPCVSPRGSDHDAAAQPTAHADRPRQVVRRGSGGGGRRSGGMSPCPFPADATLAEVGEFGADRARSRDLFPQGEHVLVGPGDDAAVLRVRNGHVVVSTDLLVEGRHFRRDWASADDVGHRAAAPEPLRHQRDGRPGALADHRAGRAARPAGAVGARLRAGLRRRVRAGRRQRGRRRPHPRPTRSSSPSPCIGACTAGARCSAPAPQPGDVLALTGRQGWAAGGLAVLGRGLPLAAGAGRGLPPPRAAVRRGRRPPRTPAPPSMIDVSDGLLADAGHLAEATPASRSTYARDAFEIARAAARRRRGPRRRPDPVHPRRRRRPRAAGDLPDGARPRRAGR